MSVAQSMSVSDSSGLRLGLGRRLRPAAPAAAAAAAVLGALALPAVAAGTAAAAVIAPAAGCFVNPTPSHAGRFLVVGSGFTPGDSVELVGNGVFATTTVAPAGTIVVTGANPILGTINPAVSKVTLTANDETTGATGLAQTQIAVANFAASISPTVPHPSQRVTWRFSGFRPGKTIWGHYRHGRRTVATVSFGRAHGPCGTQKIRARFFPGHPTHTSYSLVLDDVRHYTTAARPRLLETLRFF